MDDDDGGDEWMWATSGGSPLHSIQLINDIIIIIDDWWLMGGEWGLFAHKIQVRLMTLTFHNATTINE